MERLRRIKDIIIEYKHVDVSTLSSMLSVSEATIRKDLEKLENEGYLKRLHGGAIINEDILETNTQSILDPYIEEKKKIGIIAADLIKNKEVVFLGPGITCWEISKHIHNKKDLTIVTNNINVINELVEFDNIYLIGTGGKKKTINNTAYFIGKFTNSVLSQILINKAFITVDGISIEHGYTHNDLEFLELNNLLKEISDEIIIVADYSKFGKTAMSKFCSINDIKKVITNENIPENYKKFFFDSEIQLFTTINPE